jgi:hypothetical protein
MRLGRFFVVSMAAVMLVTVVPDAQAAAPVNGAGAAVEHEYAELAGDFAPPHYGILTVRLAGTVTLGGVTFVGTFGGKVTRSVDQQGFPAAELPPLELRGTDLRGNKLRASCTFPYGPIFTPYGIEPVQHFGACSGRITRPNGTGSGYATFALDILNAQVSERCEGFDGPTPGSTYHECWYNAVGAYTVTKT